MILCIYCSGGMGREVMDLAMDINQNHQYWSQIVFVDDVRFEKEFYGAKVFKLGELLKEYRREELEFTIANGEPLKRRKIYENLCEKGCRLGILVHPSAYVSETAKLSPGVIIEFHAMISSDTVIGTNTVIANYTMVGHDTEIGQHSFLATGSFLGGVCKIEDCSYIGPHALLKDRIMIGENSVIAMGAAVFQSIPSNTVAVGNPARPMAKRDDSDIFYS